MSQSPLLPMTERTGPGRDPTAGTKAVLAGQRDPIYALQLDNISSVNVWLSIGACMYAAACAVLLLINFMQCKKPFYDIFNMGCPDRHSIIVSPDNVHRMEFTAAFCFNCVNLLIVSYSSNKAKFQNPGLFKAWAFMNLLFSSTAMIMIWANRALFEVPSHQMEYTAEISMTFLEMKLLTHGIESHVMSPTKKRIAGILNWVPSLLAVLQIVIFNFGGTFFDVDDWSGDCSFWGYQIRTKLIGDHTCTGYGGAGGEWYGHCLEYIVGIMNAMQAFFIAVDSKLDADRDLQEIMKPFDKQDCTVSSSDMPTSYVSSSTPMAQISESEKDLTIQDLEEKNKKLEQEIAALRARR